MTQAPSDPNTAPFAKIESLQVLRAVAAAAVMFFHGTRMIEKSHGYMFLGGFFEPGFAGVDLFFVISGFIIYHTTAGTGMSRGEFLRRRLIRIYPIYWLVTAILLAYLLLKPSATMELTPLSVLANFLLLPTSPYILEVAWTLVIEIAFYALFAITYFIHPRVFFVALPVWGIASVILGPVTGIAHDSPILEIWMFSGSLEVLYGVLVALAFRRGLTKGALPALVLGLGLGALSWADIAWWGPIPMGRELQFGVPAALILYAAVNLRARFPAWLILVGDASYVLYLIHATVLSNLMKVSDAVGLPAWYATFAGSAILYICVIVVSCGAHLYVELPMTRWLKRRISPR
jgi:exopolysaccharide production protein ExoZ